MDFLFLNHSASVEAVIVFLCLTIIFLFLLYDAIIWVKQKYRELHPRKAYAQENIIEEKNDTLEDLHLSAGPLEVLPESAGNPELSTPISQILDKESVTDGDNGDTQVKGESDTLSSENNTQDNSIPEAFSLLDLAADGDAGSTDLTGIPEVDPAKIDESQGENTSPDTNLITEETQTDEVGKTDISVLAESGTREKVEKNEEHLPHKSSDKGTGESKKESKKKGLSPEKKEKVLEIVNNAKTLVARGHIDDARSLIVSGLSLEKNNRELNLLMASLYERDRAFEKAEFVLKELAEHDSDDVEVLTHLATVVAMQRKFEVSYEIYKKILNLAGETEETLYTLAHIASELGITDDIYNYSKSYLKQFPKNPEILWLYSQSQITKGERKGAIETLIKLKNLTPYNQEIVDLISKLVTEDELAGNFGENQNN